MKLVVLDERTLAVISDGELTDQEADMYRRQMHAVMPDYRAVIFRGPGEVIDMRGDVEATRLANELLDRLTAVSA